ASNSRDEYRTGRGWLEPDAHAAAHGLKARMLLVRSEDSGPIEARGAEIAVAIFQPCRDAIGQRRLATGAHGPSGLRNIGVHGRDCHGIIRIPVVLQLGERDTARHIHQQALRRCKAEPPANRGFPILASAEHQPETRGYNVTDPADIHIALDAEHQPVKLMIVADMHAAKAAARPEILAEAGRR